MEEEIMTSADAVLLMLKIMVPVFAAIFGYAFIFKSSGSRRSKRD